MTRALSRQLAREAEAARHRADDEARIAAWNAIEHPRCVECGRLSTEPHELDCLRVA